MPSHIIDGLYLGDCEDAKNFDGTIICAMQEIPEDEPMRAYWIPIIRSNIPLNIKELIADQGAEITALKHQLMIIAEEIYQHGDNLPVLVHCLAGIERSPLAVVFYLHYFKDMTWDSAYDFVKSKRPQVQNRLIWLNMSYEERMS
jgi:protein-tyrosine phosphatase